MYGGRIISLVLHFELSSSRNTSLQFVAELEQNKIIWLKEKLLENYQTEHEKNTTPEKLSKVFIKPEIKLQRNRYNAKVI